MPQAFEDCVRRGGKVRTKKLSGNRFMRICFIDGKSFPGEVKKAKGTGKKTKKSRTKMKRSR